MIKKNITKETGNVEVLSLLSAFKVENNTYVIFDSEKMGSMGLPIIYVSKYTTKLEKISDAEEWANAKNYLKGIISGTNFNYINISDNLVADDVFYTPLTLPTASFELIKSRYVVEESSKEENKEVPQVPEVVPVEAPVNNVSEIPSTPAPTPVMPSTNVGSNIEINSTPVNIEPAVVDAKASNIVPDTSINKMVDNFDVDKETFLKACENMFDALISKYQRQLGDLEERENELKIREKEIETKMQNANEHLANAEAKEAVANIAHDNAQKIMDISNLMPTNPNGNQTGVI